jgi:hypothetical protein
MAGVNHPTPGDSPDRRRLGLRMARVHVLSALALALLSTPLAALAIAHASDISTCEQCVLGGVNAPPALTFGQALPIAFLAVLAAGLVGGIVGGWMVRRSPAAGLVVAVLVAWPVAIATLPVVPTLTGSAFTYGFECIGSCGPVTSTSAGGLFSGIALYGLALLVGGIAVVPPLVAIVCGYFARRALKGSGDQRVVAVWGLLGVAAINIATFFSLAFGALVIGALIWVSPYWRRSPAINPSPAPSIEV